MAQIKPFQAYRPKKGLEDKIAALPYDVYSREEAKIIISENPHSFLKIDRAETQFNDSVDIYADCVYKKAKELFCEMIENGEFIQEQENVYYVYELTMGDRTQTGLVACASIDDYFNQVIKKHENTRAEKEVDRIKHVSALEAQTGPIFLAYRRNEKIAEMIKKIKMQNVLYDFVLDDHIGHRVWIIDNKDEIEFITKEFKKMSRIYIADGHHRCASAAKVGKMYRENNSNYTGTEEFNYFLSVLFPDDELKILDYNRVVKDLNGNSVENFLKQIEEKFHIVENSLAQLIPRKKGEVCMFLESTWYRLQIKKEFLVNDPVDGLDVSILQNTILHPILAINDPKTDERIDFVGGIRGLSELERRVKTDAEVAFAMYPTSIEELFSVADANKLMPPKSTWFEPKLRSGLFIHSIKE